MAKEENFPTWICDRCKAERNQPNKPNTASDAWGYLKIDQNSGFDYNGCSWAPRMRDPLLLCSGCINDIFQTLNKCPGIEIEPGVHSGCQGGIDCPICGIK